LPKLKNKYFANNKNKEPRKGGNKKKKYNKTVEVKPKVLYNKIV